jgi:hypothetical protein
MTEVGHYTAKNHATKNVIEPKWAPGPLAQYRRTPWQSATVWSLASVPTRQVMFLFHHIIIIMDIDDDMMDAILNNKQKSVRPWNARVRLVSEVAGLNGME